MATLDLLAEQRIARITLPTRSGAALTLDCVARLTGAPYFEAHFLPGELPAGELDTDGACQLHFDANGGPHVIKAHIEAVAGEDRLRLQAIEAAAPRQKREYFRVDAEIGLGVKPRQELDAGETFRGTVNLSGGGAFFPLQGSVKEGSELLLNLNLGGAFGETREVVGEVIRSRENRRGGYQVAVRFVKIAPADRDRIISFCLAQQRKQLRLRVLVQ